MVYGNQDEVRVLNLPILSMLQGLTGGTDAGRPCAQEGHPLRRQARGGVHHLQALEHVAPPGPGGEGARRDAQAAPARLRRSLPCVEPLLTGSTTAMS